jgi:hypothetical protein
LPSRFRSSHGRCGIGLHAVYQSKKKRKKKRSTARKIDPMTWRHISQAVSFGAGHSWLFQSGSNRRFAVFWPGMLPTFRNWPKYVIYSSLCARCSLRSAETFSVRKWRRSNIAFWRISVELSWPSALKTRLMHFPFENWNQDTKKLKPVPGTVMYIHVDYVYWFHQFHVFSNTPVCVHFCCIIFFIKRNK